MSAVFTLHKRVLKMLTERECCLYASPLWSSRLSHRQTVASSGQAQWCLSKVCPKPVEVYLSMSLSVRSRPMGAFARRLPSLRVKHMKRLPALEITKEEWQGFYKPERYTILQSPEGEPCVFSLDGKEPLAYREGAKFYKVDAPVKGSRPSRKHS